MFMASVAPGLALCRCKTELDFLSVLPRAGKSYPVRKDNFSLVQEILHMMAVKNLWNSEVVSVSPSKAKGKKQPKMKN